jgi:fluoroacetyl-CoA thioesterase
MRTTLRPGLTGTLTYQVPAERTVAHLLPESAGFRAMPEVLATGYLVGIVEWACMQLLHGHLDDGEQTLGVHVDLSHEAPTPVGGIVQVAATLSRVEGRRLLFEVEARDDSAVISRGTHRRAVIDRRRFDERLALRAVDPRTQLAGEAHADQ